MQIRSLQSGVRGYLGDHEGFLQVLRKLLKLSHFVAINRSFLVQIYTLWQRGELTLSNSVGILMGKYI